MKLNSNNIPNSSRGKARDSSRKVRRSPYWARMAHLTVPDITADPMDMAQKRETQLMAGLEEPPFLTPFTVHDQIKHFFPMPRLVLQMGIGSSAVLLYCLLLDRATLSQQNGWCNHNGWVYVNYTVSNLSEELNLDESSIRRLLLQLEQRKLIFRTHPYIYLRVPKADTVTKIPCDSYPGGCSSPVFRPTYRSYASESCRRPKRDWRRNQKRRL